MQPTTEEIAAEAALAEPPPANATTLDELDAWLRAAKPAVAFVPLDLILSSAISDQDVDVARYAEDMRAGAQFPPVTLAGAARPFLRRDGQHRIAAARLVGAKTILARIDYDEAFMVSRGTDPVFLRRRFPFDPRLRDDDHRTRCGSGAGCLSPRVCDERPIWLASSFIDFDHGQPSHRRRLSPLAAYCGACFESAKAKGQIYLPQDPLPE